MVASVASSLAGGTFLAGFLRWPLSVKSLERRQCQCMPLFMRTLSRSNGTSS